MNELARLWGLAEGCKVDRGEIGNEANIGCLLDVDGYIL